jgi:hypothetical protein
MKLSKRLVFSFLVMALILSVFVAPAAATSVQATPTTSTVLVNGQEVKFQAYLINGNNYFRLRDVAFALTGTEKQFQAAYDGITNQLVMPSHTL